MHKIPTSIAIAGVIPFVLLSITISMHVFTHVEPVLRFLLVYAVVILAFLGGIHWGVAVAHSQTNRRIANWLIIESVLPALAAWLVILYADIYIQLLALTLLYMLMWVVDSILYNKNIIPLWFFNLRGIITPIVVVSLYVAYFGLV